MCKIATMDTHFVLMLACVSITVDTSGAGKFSVAWERRKYVYSIDSIRKGHSANSGRRKCVRLLLLSTLQVFRVCYVVTSPCLISASNNGDSTGSLLSCSHRSSLYKFGADRIDNTVSKFICYCMCIRCHGNMFAEPLPSNGCLSCLH
jgi:hypothetical protein